MRQVAAVLCILTLWAPPAGADTAEPLFDTGTLHDVWIHINSRDWAVLRATFQENTYYPCDFEWRGVKVFNAGCRSRGGGTRNGVKPGLLVTFDHYVEGQQFLGLSSLVLDNLWQDRSMMKEWLSMLLFSRLGLAAPRESFARVFVGGARDFNGVYAIVEDIDRPFLARHFDTDAGYLYEYRWMDEYRFENLGSDLEPYAARFEARTHERESTFTLYAPIRDLVRAISDASPDDLLRALEPHLDVPAFLTHLAVENYLSEWDGLLGYAGINNFYLYRPAPERAARLVPWDKDLAFQWLEMPPWHGFDTNVLAAKVWASPPLRDAYLQQLLDASAEASMLREEASRAYRQIRDAAFADTLKPATNAEFDSAVEEVLRFLDERETFVRGMVAQVAPDLLTAAPAVPRAQ